MTAQGEDVLAWLETAITAREDAARSAHATDPAPWTAETATEPTFDHTREAGSGILVAADGNPLWDCEGASALCMTAAASIHASLHDPASVLRRCAADRKLLALHGGKCHSCPATDETDYLDEWTQFDYGDMCPVVQLLAEGYGWTEGKR